MLVLHIWMEILAWVQHKNIEALSKILESKASWWSNLQWQYRYKQQQQGNLHIFSSTQKYHNKNVDIECSAHDAFL